MTSGPAPVLPRRVRRPLTELPLAAVGAVVVAGLAVTYTHHFRLGAFIVGLGVLLATVLRLALPVRRAGMLTVRSRAIDVTVLLTLATAIILLAIFVPRQHS